MAQREDSKWLLQSANELLEWLRTAQAPPNMDKRLVMQLLAKVRDDLAADVWPN